MFKKPILKNPKIYIIYIYIYNIASGGAKTVPRTVSRANSFPGQTRSILPPAISLFTAIPYVEQFVRLMGMLKCMCPFLCLILTNYFVFVQTAAFTFVTQQHIIPSDLRRRGRRNRWWMCGAASTSMSASWTSTSKSMSKSTSLCAKSYVSIPSCKINSKKLAKIPQDFGEVSAKSWRTYFDADSNQA